MKQLFLIRHGKATHEAMPDIKRYLTDKGIKRTRKHAGILAEKQLKPDLIISSPAIRAFQTAEILAETLQYPKKDIVIDPKFYFFPQEEVANQIENIPDRYKRVFLVGHNPIWTDLSDQLSENGLWHLRTSGIFGVEFDTDTWQNVFQAPRKNLITIN